MTDEAARLGPCIICGDMGYSLSCGGPTICPQCDCGNFDAATVQKQARVIADLREQLAYSCALTREGVALMEIEAEAERYAAMYPAYSDGRNTFIIFQNMIATKRRLAVHPIVADDRAQPRVTDNDAGEISVAFNGNELRGWSYASDDERRIKMLAAREYVEGWCDGRNAK